MTDDAPTPPVLDEALIARVEALLEQAKAGSFGLAHYAVLVDVSDLRTLIASARHHADEIAAYRSQLDTTQRALAIVVAERDAAKFAARLGIVERVEAAAALVLASGHIHDDAMMIAAALENGGFYICRALATKPAAEGK